MRLLAAVGLGFGLLGGIAAANAADCPGNPGAIGTSRVLKIDPREHPRLGTMQYQKTLPLAEKEVVLTFDDGPMPPYTNRILEILAHECVKTNYFIIGRMARGYPGLLRRIHAEGHVIGTHSENHPLAFDRMPARAVQNEIDQGIASTVAALGNRDAVAPFFRIPGLLRADAVESYLRARGLVTWSADVAADDWKHVSASDVVSRSIARLEAKGKGILLLHDIQPATALALPHLLRELKRRGYKIVQVAPAEAPVPVASAPRQPVQFAAKPLREAQPTPFPATTPPPAAARLNPPVNTAAATPIVPEIRAVEPALPPPAAAAATATPAQPDPALAGAAEPRGAQANSTANSTPTSAGESEPPPGRAMPVPILEAARIVPGNPSATQEQPARPTTRPLTPGFKPSHNASMPEKVPDMPPEPRRIDTWGMRAEAVPASRAPVRTAWPLTASSLTHALPR